MSADHSIFNAFSCLDAGLIWMPYTSAFCHIIRMFCKQRLFCMSGVNLFRHGMHHKLLHQIYIDQFQLHRISDLVQDQQSIRMLLDPCRS